MDPSRVEMRPKKSSRYSGTTFSLENSPAYARPMTSFLRDTYERLLPSSLKLGSSSIISGQSPDEDKAANVLAEMIKKKIIKIINHEHKKIAMYREVAAMLGSWGEHLPTAENQRMVEEYGSLIQLQANCDKVSAERLEGINRSLANIGIREKKKNDLKAARIKLHRLFKESQLKSGTTASGTVLLSEKLEENSTNLQVIDRQFGRAISKELKETLMSFFAHGEYANKEISLSMGANYAKLAQCESEYSTRNNSKQNLGIRAFTEPSYDLGVSSNPDNSPKVEVEPSQKQYEEEQKKVYEPRKAIEKQKGDEANLQRKGYEPYEQKHVPYEENVQNGPEGRQNLYNNEFKMFPSYGMERNESWWLCTVC